MIELISDLPTFTWEFSKDDNILTSGSQIITQAAIQPLPGITIPARTAGTIVGSPASVVWHMHNNGWQFVQVVIKLLEMQVIN